MILEFKVLSKDMWNGHGAVVEILWDCLGGGGLREPTYPR